MRMLKKINTDGPLFPWTQILADRGDMVEATAEVLANAGDETDVVSSSDSTIDPLAITDKDELKRLLAERGVKLPGNPGLTTLQAKLAEVLANAGD